LLLTQSWSLLCKETRLGASVPYLHCRKATRCEGPNFDKQILLRKIWWRKEIA